LTVADPGDDAADDVAVTVTAAGFGTVAGAVYKPLELIVPLALPPVTAHVTVWLVELLTVAENCCCVALAGHVFPASFAYIWLVFGVTLTVTGGGVDVVLPPPQASMTARRASEKQNSTAIERLDALPFIFPCSKPAITNPAIGSVSGNQGERLSARRCKLLPLPVFGPFVWIVTVTVVADAPAAIDVGEKTQLLFVNVGSAGVKAQLKVTAPAKVAADVGVALKV
jgi:hypothetical protein